MSIVERVNELLQTDQYRFLRENEHLKDRIIFLTLGGSHAYGTNNENSDLDIRGVCHERPQDLIGLSSFEQVDDSATDTVVYAFGKLIKLLLNVNPNVCEMLGNKPEHYFMITPVGRELIANRKMFLSRRAIKSFSGYANSQLFRLRNHLGTHAVTDELLDEHLMRTINLAWSGNDGIASRHGIDPDGVRFWLDNNHELIVEQSTSGCFKTNSIEFCAALSEANNIARSQTKLGKRNKNAISGNKVAKHACHLIRLFLMCLDILEKEEIITYRENDLDLLIAIRNGKYLREDGVYEQEFFDMIEDFEKRLKYAAENTSLPKDPDYKRVEEFVMTVNRSVLK